MTGEKAPTSEAAPTSEVVITVPTEDLQVSLTVSNGDSEEEEEQCRREPPSTPKVKTHWSEEKQLVDL